MGPSFNENFAKKHTCGSHEQCTGPTNFYANAAKSEFQLYPNSRLVLVSNVFKKIIYCPTSGIIEDMKNTQIISQENTSSIPVNLSRINKVRYLSQYLSIY